MTSNGTYVPKSERVKGNNKYVQELEIPGNF